MKIATIASFLLGFVLTFVFQEQTKGIFITFGQGHFLLAYLYMHKAGKITKTGLVKYLTVFALLISLYFFVFDFKVLIFVTSFYFIVHFAVDVYFLNGNMIRIDKLLLAATPFFCISLSRILLFTGMNDFSNYLLYLFPATVLLVLFTWKETDYLKILLLAFSLVIFISRFFDITWMFFYFMSIVMIAHYIMWYLFFFVKRNSDFIKPYVFNVIIVNAIMVTFFCYYYFYTDQSFLPGKLMYQEDAFYLWTLMHFVATFRLENFKKEALENAT